MSKPLKPRDEKLFEELMTYKNSIFSICLGFSRNPQDAEELTQDVYLKALSKLGTLRDKQSARIWLLRICRNTCLDHVKKMRFKSALGKTSERHHAEFNNPESQLVISQQLQHIKDSIQHLPRRMKEVFVLKEYGDLSYQEIAFTLGIKKGTVMSRLNRARQAVVEMVKGKMK
jgi:RNA polymerase sigma-70 factor (ECF subfamily)